MISSVKKATHKDIYKIAYAIMCLKTTSECITTEEAKNYIDRCYYCEDTKGNVIAIVAAERVVYEFPAEVAGETIKTYPNKYKIKYMLYDAYAIKSMDEEPSSIMRELVRELTADMNDWTVTINLGSQIKMSLNDSDECKDSLDRALKFNGFRGMSSDDEYLLRGTPLNFDSFH